MYTDVCFIPQLARIYIIVSNIFMSLSTKKCVEECRQFFEMAFYLFIHLLIDWGIRACACSIASIENKLL